ncbi:type III-B CRISPR module RAMP protein Cmr4 [Frankia canadensis]|nr:type III-B CRISPR module RAMP protein Cmr4 [Frankia canadensis]
MVTGDAGLLFCYAESPVHAGGSESAGVVDLPIQREQATRLPTVWGQSAKGALRDLAVEHARLGTPGWPRVERVFGSAPPGSAEAGGTGADGTGADGAGADGPPLPGWLAVGDVRLVAFPVPTLARTFAWVTSPLALSRLLRLGQLAGRDDLPAVPTISVGDVAPASSRWGETGAGLAVGEHNLTIVEPPASLSAWATWLATHALPADDASFGYFRKKLATDLLLVSDDDLAALTEEHVELLPRVQLRADAKTVAAGPWYTEYLPAETLLCTLLRDCVPPAGEARSRRLADLGGVLDNELLVAGGDETLGKGMLWLRWCGTAAR